MHAGGCQDFGIKIILFHRPIRAALLVDLWMCEVYRPVLSSETDRLIYR